MIDEVSEVESQDMLTSVENEEIERKSPRKIAITKAIHKEHKENKNKLEERTEVGE